jgi:hypothetical protein
MPPLTFHRAGPPKTTRPGPEIPSFYHLPSTQEAAGVCQGLTCFVSRHLDPGRWRAATGQTTRVQCLGKCYIGPASAEDTDRPRVEVAAREPVVLGRLARLPSPRAVASAAAPAWTRVPAERSRTSPSLPWGFPRIGRARPVRIAGPGASFRWAPAMGGSHRCFPSTMRP